MPRAMGAPGGFGRQRRADAAFAQLGKSPPPLPARAYDPWQILLSFDSVTPRR
jgi:hypothetical protein